MTIAVVGAGPIGLAALKNLREEGFDATIFEKGSVIGGIWDFNIDPTVTSVLETTVANVSRFKVSINAFINFQYNFRIVLTGNVAQSCYTDFPVSDDWPDFLTAPQVCQYLNAYARYFDLNKHIVFNTEVQSVVRSSDETKWELHLLKNKTTYEIVEYDKVVFCTGIYQKPFIPDFEGSGSFRGKLIHAQAFKRPEDFKEMKVLLVGLGNTAVDTATSLVGHASKIYVAHRRGAHIFPRHCAGKPIDLNIQRRNSDIKHFLTAYMPVPAAKLNDNLLIGITKDSFGDMKPEWDIHPPPSIQTHQPVITETFIDRLKDGSIVSCSGLRAFTGENEVELLDGIQMKVDTVIFCTGYEANLSIMPDLDPTRATSSFETGLKSKINSGPLARLYQNIFEPKHPDSIAYLCYWSFTVGAIPIGDLMIMALSQLWKDFYKFPSEAEMNKEIDKHHAWIINLAKKDSVYGNIIQEGPWQKFLHDAAGTGCNENLGYGIRGWLFWLRNPLWCNMLMTGIDSPHSWRLFDGKRKKWARAKEAIIQANYNAKKFMK